MSENLMDNLDGLVHKMHAQKAAKTSSLRIESEGFMKGRVKGEVIVFRGDGDVSYIMNSDGSNLVEISHNKPIGWSGDGSSLFIESNKGIHIKDNYTGLKNSVLKVDMFSEKKSVMNIPAYSSAVSLRVEDSLLLFKNLSSGEVSSSLYRPSKNIFTHLVTDSADSGLKKMFNEGMVVEQKMFVFPKKVHDGYDIAVYDFEEDVCEGEKSGIVGLSVYFTPGLVPILSNGVSLFVDASIAKIFFKNDKEMDFIDYIPEFDYSTLSSSIKYLYALFVEDETMGDGGSLDLLVQTDNELVSYNLDSEKTTMLVDHPISPISISPVYKRFVYSDDKGVHVCDYNGNKKFLVQGSNPSWQPK